MGSLLHVDVYHLSLMNIITITITITIAISFINTSAKQRPTIQQPGGFTSKISKTFHLTLIYLLHIVSDNNQLRALGGRTASGGFW
jgi:hypothetical protein